MAAEITFAKDKSTRKLKHISDVTSGNSCNCICLECGFELQARKGGERDHHFKHNNPNCQSTFETALHKAAIEIIVQNHKLVIPDWGFTNYSSPVAEESWNKYRPDVKITTNRGQIFVEVVVTHYITAEKAKEYLKNNILCLEIDLSCEDRNINREELKTKVLFEVENKTLSKIIKPKAKKLNVSHGENDDGVKVLLVTIAIVAARFIYKQFTRRKNWW